MVRYLDSEVDAEEAWGRSNTLDGTAHLRIGANASLAAHQTQTTEANDIACFRRLDLLTEAFSAREMDTRDGLGRMPTWLHLRPRWFECTQGIANSDRAGKYSAQHALCALVIHRKFRSIQHGRPCSPPCKMQLLVSV